MTPWIRVRELDPRPDGPAASSEDEEVEHRTGQFTSGVVSTTEGRRIALFFTGRQHAGENLRSVLAKRAAELEAPIQMCDGLSRNLPKELEVILANCLAHGRRKFVAVTDAFPDEVKRVLETLRDVYGHDALARKQNMSPPERLAFHQEKSRPLMDEFEVWMKDQIEQKLVEPNSGLGQAMNYMLKRWDKLTRFLHEPDAPLDNNLCERALKKAILHRKNSLFFKTLKGAHVSDLFMSLIHTCELEKTGTFDYLVALLKHPEQIADAPQDWMPWNYPGRPESPAPSEPVDCRQTTEDEPPLF